MLQCRLRDKCLSVYVFFTLDHIREKFARWQQGDNLLRPHGSLHAQVPASCAEGWSATAWTAHASTNY